MFQSDGYSDANGNYAVGVVGGLGNGDPWWLQIDNGSGTAIPPTTFIHNRSLIKMAAPTSRRDRL